MLTNICFHTFSQAAQCQLLGLIRCLSFQIQKFQNNNSNDNVDLGSSMAQRKHQISQNTHKSQSPQKPNKNYPKLHQYILDDEKRG